MGKLFSGPAKKDNGQLGPYFNFAAFIFLLIGIFFANLFPFYIFFVFFFALSTFFACFLANKNNYFYSDLAVSFLIFSLGGLLFLAAGSVDKDKFLEGRPEFVIKVTSLPDQAFNRNTFLAEVLEVEKQKENFRVRVFDYSKKMNYLNKYRLRANLSKRVYQGREFYNLWVKKDAQVDKLSLSFWEDLIKKVNYYCLGVFSQNCDKKAKNFLAAVFLGRRELMGSQQVFIRDAGLSHLLAISGLHIGLISLILFYFLRFFNLNFKTSLLISCIFLIFYAFLTGLRASTQRAVLMYLAFAFGFLAKRNVNLLNSLGLAGVILLLVSPALAYDIGFQLSFTAVLGIIIGFKIFPYSEEKNFFLNSAKQIFLSSFFVFIFIFPLISYYFNRIYSLSIFYNLILIPFFSLILFLNFFLLIFSFSAFIAESLGAVLSWLIYFFQSLARFLGMLPISHFSYSFTLRGLSLYYIFLFLILFALFKLKSRHQPGQERVS